MPTNSGGPPVLCTQRLCRQVVVLLLIRGHGDATAHGDDEGATITLAMATLRLQLAQYSRTVALAATPVAAVVVVVAAAAVDVAMVAA